MARVDNWNELFVKEILRLKEDPSMASFAWVPPSSQPLGGRLDNVGQSSEESGYKFHCFSFMTHMVKLITGRDYYKEYAEHLEYDDPKSAMLAMRSLGYKRVDQLVGSIWQEKRLSRVIRGDIVLVPGEEFEGEDLAVAVADPPYAWVMHPVNGLCRVYISEAVKAYEVE